MAKTDGNNVVPATLPPEPDEIRKIEKFWTPERMESAEPIPMPEIDLANERNAPPRRNPFGTRTPSVTAPVLPDGHPVHLVSPGFHTEKVQDMSNYPYSVVGKLFMRFGERIFSSTGWVIGERSVFTAGHCVYDRQLGWANYVLFAAQYDTGNAIGRWPLGRLATLGGWINTGHPIYDMGVGISAGNIRPATGKAGYITNMGRIRSTIKSTGYPAKATATHDFDGKQMWECDGDYIGLENGVQLMSNNMTDGASGGPGFYQQSGTWFVVWVNSFREPSQPNILRSPYLGVGFTNLTKWMRNNGGDS